MNKFISNVFAVICITLSALVTTLASAQVTVTASTESTANVPPAQYLPPGKYLVDTVPTVMLPGGAIPYYGHDLVISGEDQNNWEGSRFYFYGTRQPCFSPAEVTQRISGDEIILSILWSKTQSICGDGLFVLKKTTDGYTMEGWTVSKSGGRFLRWTGKVRAK